MRILQGYDIIARNQHGSMLYLRPSKWEQHVNGSQGIIERSVAYLHANKFNRAISLLKEAIITNPDNADLYNNLCVAYGVKKKYMDAVSACLNALRIAPDYQLAKNNLAWVEHENRTRNEL